MKERVIMNTKEYFLGLDMGTNSIGWAVTDYEYNLLRAKGKDLWGIREFDEASHAVDRRNNRVARRRRQREVVRLGLVKSYFAEEIEKVDKNFFARIDNSKYHLEDKDENAQAAYTLFNDDTYTDVAYFTEYPTIFHLRKELIENPEPHDIRLVYLAISNMFKHRGHFLNETLSDSDNTRNIQLIYDELQKELFSFTENSDNVIDLPSVDANRMIEILGNRDISRTEKSEKLMKLLGIDKKEKQKVEFIRCICGLKTDAKKMFPEIEIEEKKEICFDDFSYEDKISDIIEAVGDSNYVLIELMKEIYDAGILSGILKDSKYLSFARVESYNKHKKDLWILKQVIKKYGTEEVYDSMFRSEEVGSYSVYVNSYNNEKKKRRDMGGSSARTIEMLYKKINSIISRFPEDEDVVYIKNEMKKENFLPKQLTGANGVIPNQVHKKELVKILDNASNYLDFLNEKDESGLTIAERIVQLFAFHIPYYIGPTSENSAKNGGNGWVVRKEPGKILPWNIYEKIDKEKTSEKFIMNMVRNCTYFRNEKVLPKASLLYEKFCVLNEINNLSINGERVSVDLKQSIYKDLFEKGKNVSRKSLEKYLLGKGLISSEAEITGIDKTINNSLSSYGKFLPIFGEKIKEDKYVKIIEQIISWATIFGDSREMFKEKLENEYGGILDANQIKRILGYKFKDWGNLSKEFLELSGCEYGSGEIVTLISAMWENNLNLMELINSDQFSFKSEIEKRRTEALASLSDIKVEDLDEYYFSRPVKRMIWQTVLLIKEITKIMGCEPNKIFVEMTRSDEEKGDAGRKNSRKKQLLELYKNVSDEMNNWKELIEKEDSSGRLKSKKMYLYLKQMGRDIYTGKSINLDDLFNDNMYDIDHIYPRAFVKDDNIENNLVLVSKDKNNRKQDYYPIDERIANDDNVRNLWNMLHAKGFINDEKFKRLTSRAEFTENQKAGFIARQMVETSQAAKGLADIIKSVCKNTEIVYSKAGNVSDFRRKYELYKSRLLNDFHHANDAYLNIVVGNAYLVKFTNNPYNFIKKDYAMDAQKNHYHLGKIFDYDIVRGDKIGWIAKSRDGKAATIETVKKVMAKNTPLMTRMNFVEMGKLYDVMPVSKEKAKPENYAELKSGLDVSKYGGYNSINPAYFIFIEYSVGSKRKRCFDSIPIMYLKNIKTQDDLIHYCENKLGYKDVRVIYSKIKKGSLLKIDGYLAYIMGCDSRKNIELHNAINLCVNPDYLKYIRILEKYNGKYNLCNELTYEDNMRLYELLVDKHSKGILAKNPKQIGSLLTDKKNKFETLPIDVQATVLYQLFCITKIGTSTQNLKVIEGPSEAGRLRVTGNMTDKTQVLLINQSITGVYEEKIDLLKV